MASSITWLDHDQSARDRALQILALFQVRESRDELGLGGIRDSLADMLFPGTSTLHTRLRYVLFVPWIYQELEQERLTPQQFAAKADRTERALIGPLVASGDAAGVFGRTAGNQLKRLPSSIYWAALGAWGIRLTPYSQGEYHNRIAETRSQRAAVTDRRRLAEVQGDDVDQPPQHSLHNWHPRLPPAPAGFPNQASLALTNHEAVFIRDLIVRQCSGSLLAHLALLEDAPDVAAPWEHPAFGEFSSDHKLLLRNAQLFAELMQGASLSYNYQLARLAANEELAERHKESLQTWLEELPENELAHWSTGSFWNLLIGSSHSISVHTKRFVESWHHLVMTAPDALLDDSAALGLVRRREERLKGARSRFRNRRALEQWRGFSGVGRFEYRWPNVKALLQDLQDGLRR